MPLSPASVSSNSVSTNGLNVFLDGVSRQLRQKVLTEAGLKDRHGVKLPLDLVFQLTIAMALRPNLGISSVLEELVEVVGKPLTWRGKQPLPSSITAARDRLGWTTVRTLYRAHACEQADALPDCHGWRGLRVGALDGTTFRAPDSAANELAFQRPGGRNGPGGFPAIRCLALVDVMSHQVRAATLGPYKGPGTGELSLAKLLVDQFPANMVVLMDRGFCSYGWLRELVSRDVPFVVRLKTGKNTVTPIRQKVLAGDEDWLVEFPVPNSFRPKRGAKPLKLRRIKWSLPKRRSKKSKLKKPRGSRRRTRRAKAKKVAKRTAAQKASKPPKLPPRHVLLLTNLTDAEAYPCAEIAQLYLQRWEVEFVFREIKATLTNRKVDFRSKRPGRVLQEAYALLLAYNVTRQRIAEAAGRRRRPIDLSYTKCLTAIRDAYRTGACLPQLLAKLARYKLKRREPRRYPRAVKCRSTRYPTKANAIAA